jgi:hypothetical protein
MKSRLVDDDLAARLESGPTEGPVISEINALMVLFYACHSRTTVGY